MSIILDSTKFINECVFYSIQKKREE